MVFDLGRAVDQIGTAFGERLDRAGEGAVNSLLDRISGSDKKDKKKTVATTPNPAAPLAPASTRPAWLLPLLAALAVLLVGLLFWKVIK